MSAPLVPIPHHQIAKDPKVQAEGDEKKEYTFRFALTNWQGLKGKDVTIFLNELEEEVDNIAPFTQAFILSLRLNQVAELHVTIACRRQDWEKFTRMWSELLKKSLTAGYLQQYISDVQPKSEPYRED